MSDLSNCCEGIEDATPVVIDNRAGLSALAYRVGTHSRFKETMLARLSSKDFKTLKFLNTREDDDFSIALLDSWAMVADILTFYQERLANESYLRTAVERLSLVELARLLDYQIRPGVAADTNLVFTLQTAVGAPQIVTIGEGVKVQSIPAPGQQAQTFETVEAITARPFWNALQPRLGQRQTFDSANPTIYFAGAATNLKPGDAVYFKPDSGADVFGIVVSADVETEEKVVMNAQPTSADGGAVTVGHLEADLRHDHAAERDDCAGWRGGAVQRSARDRGLAAKRRDRAGL